MSNDEFLEEEELYERIKEQPKEGFGSFHKRSPEEKVWWVDTGDMVAMFLFSFDKKEVFNLFRDYPHKLTPEQKAIFDAENREYADFISENL